jgi:hypothetical protein
MADPDNEQNGERDGETDRVHQLPFWFREAFQLQSRTNQYPPIHQQLALGGYGNEDHGRFGQERYHIVSILIW